MPVLNSIKRYIHKYLPMYLTIMNKENLMNRYSFVNNSRDCWKTSSCKENVLG